MIRPRALQKEQTSAASPFLNGVAVKWSSANHDADNLILQLQPTVLRQGRTSRIGHMPAISFLPGTEPIDGYDWVRIGRTEPSVGREVTNTKLASKLSRAGKRAEFTREEWEEFGITDLCTDHYGARQH